MRVEVLTVPDCPNRSAALARVAEALDRTGVTALVIERVIDDPSVAASAGMAGSPTVLIDGRDVCAAEAAEPSISCRLYYSDSGVGGAPSVPVLIEALTNAAAGGRP